MLLLFITKSVTFFCPVWRLGQYICWKFQFQNEKGSCKKKSLWALRLWVCKWKELIYWVISQKSTENRIQTVDKLLPTFLKSESLLHYFYFLRPKNNSKYVWNGTRKNSGICFLMLKWISKLVLLNSILWACWDSFVMQS